MQKIAILLCGVIILFSCKKDEKYSTTPEIEFISLTPSSVNEFSKNINLTIAYKDGDGDIGTEDPDSYTLLIKDTRLSNADEYHIQPLSPPGSEIQIEGELNLKMPGLFVLGSGTSESTRFTIKLKDRAGNWSNEVTSTSITVNK